MIHPIDYHLDALKVAIVALEYDSLNHFKEKSIFCLLDACELIVSSHEIQERLLDLEISTNELRTMIYGAKMQKTFMQASIDARKTALAALEALRSAMKNCELSRSTSLGE